MCSHSALVTLHRSTHTGACLERVMEAPGCNARRRRSRRNGVSSARMLSLHRHVNLSRCTHMKSVLKAHARGTRCGNTCHQSKVSCRPTPFFFLALRGLLLVLWEVHSEFIRLLFLQAHRETERFFAASGVQLAQSTSGLFFHFRHAAFLSQLKAKVCSTLVKTAALRVNLNLDGTPTTSRIHTHPSHSQTSRLLTSSLFS